MRAFTTEAKNRFGSLSVLAKREPVFVEKAGQLHTVIMSAEQCLSLKASNNKHPANSRNYRVRAIR